jgi:DNA-binding CsgD family transcriptional regulator
MGSGVLLHGRDAELAALGAALAEQRPYVLVGEAGIGKTSLLRAAATASTRGIVETGGLATLRWVPRFVLARALGRTELVGDLENAAGLVERAVGGGVLLLDDVQWADAESVRALPYLVGRVSLLAAVRRDDPDADAAVKSLAEAGFEIREVGPLSADASAQLVGSERPDLPNAMVVSIVHSAGGNPLLLRELAVTGEPSVSFKRAVTARLRSLSTDGLDAVALLGLAGRSLEDDGSPGYGEAVQRGFADRHGMQVQLRHGLIGEIAAEELDAARRSGLHARLARLVADPVEVAQHFALAGDRASAHRTARAAAAQTDVPGVRAALLGLAAANADGADGDRLRLEAAEDLCRAGDFKGVSTALEGLQTEEPELRALAGLFRSRALWEAGDDDGYRRELAAARALVAGSGSVAEARLRIEAVRLPVFLDNDPAGLQEAESAVELARDRGVDVPRALNLLGVARNFLVGEGWEEPFDEAIRLARASGDALTELYAANNLVSGYEAAGRSARAHEIAQAAAARADELGLVSLRRQLVASDINLDLHAGNYQRVIDDGEALLGELVEQRTIDQLLSALTLVYVDRGGFKRASELAERLARGSARAGWVRAELDLWAGRPTAAVEHADAFVALDYVTDDQRLLAFVARAWAFADLEREPADELPPATLPLTLPIPVEIEALRQLVRGEAATAADLFVEAADGYRGVHLRGELRSLFAAGEAFRRAGAEDSGREILLDVERRAESRGMAPLLTRVHRSLRLVGVRRAAPRGTNHPLTPREQELLELVRHGLSNVEIGRRLGLSRRTVETELRAAARKLGASSRAQAALLAASE